MNEELLQERLKNAPKWQLENYNKFVEEYLHGVELTAIEQRYVLWLCGFDKETMQVLGGIYSKTKQ